MTETKYSKILVAIDGSKESMNAARHAIGLAKKDRARIITLTAMRLPSLYGWAPTESPYTWQKKYTKERKKWFEEIEKLAKENNVKIQTEIVESTMSAQGTIVKYAECKMLFCYKGQEVKEGRVQKKTSKRIDIVDPSVSDLSNIQHFPRMIQ